MMIFINEVGD